MYVVLVIVIAQHNEWHGIVQTLIPSIPPRVAIKMKIIGSTIIQLRLKVLKYVEIENQIKTKLQKKNYSGCLK